MSNFCQHCGHQVSPKATSCPSCGHPLAAAKVARKSKPAAVILGFMFGLFGAHRFYLRDYGLAVTILIVSLFSATFDSSGVLLGLMSLGVVIDSIVLLFRGRAYYEAKAAK